MGNENNEKIILQHGDFVGREIDGKDVLCMINDKGGLVPIANHIPVVINTTITDDGFTQREKICMSARHNGRSEKPIYAEKKTVRSNTPDVIFSSGCYIYPGRGNTSNYTTCILEQCDMNEKVNHVYTHSGFIETEDGLVFLNGDHSICESGLTDKYNVELPSGLNRLMFYKGHERMVDAFNTVLGGMAETAMETIHIPLYAYVFLTPLNHMLREQGEEPSFILYVIGETGTYKSSISKIMLNFFGKYNYADSAPMSFFDSLNTIRQKLGVGADTLLLLDDRRPTTTYKDKGIYETIEKEVSAAIGDRVGRGRLNPDGSFQTVCIPRCNLIITAEEAYQNVGSSGIARSVAVEVKKGDVNFENLRNLQDHPEHFNLIMQKYIQYVIKNYKAIKSDSKELLKKYREEAYGKGHARLATSYSQLMLGYTMFLRFLVSEEVFSFISKVDAETLTDKARWILLDLCRKQDDRINADKPTILFIESLKELIETKKVYIHDITKHMSGTIVVPTGSVHIGYSDDNYCYLIPQTTYAAVLKFCSESGTAFPAGKTTLWKQLIGEGKIVPEISPNGKITNAKNVMINGKQSRYICMLKSALDAEGGEKDG